MVMIETWDVFKIVFGPPIGGINQMNDRCFLANVISDIYGIHFKLHPKNWNNAQLDQGSDKGGGVVQRILIGTRHKA